MKKIIMATCLCMSLAVSASAQGQSFGIKGALQFTGLAVQSDQINDTELKSGFSAGLINRHESQFITVQTELLWSRKGTNYELSDGGTTVNANLDYVEIPISFGIKLFGSPLSIYGGAYAAYLLNSKYEYEDAAEVLFATYDRRDAFRKLDLGFQTGIQLRIDNLLLDTRFSRGLINVEKDDIIIDRQNFTANKTKNYNLQFSVGFLF